MAKLIEEFWRGWQGTSQPRLSLAIGFAIVCIALATLMRWGLAQIRPDVFFTPYFPAVMLATMFGGYRIGTFTAIAAGALGIAVNFGDTTVDSARVVLLIIYWAVCGVAIWGVEHYRMIAAHHHDISRRL